MAKQHSSLDFGISIQGCECLALLDPRLLIRSLMSQDTLSQLLARL
ncbi:MAG: hypothetical protein ACJ0GX_11680 [Parasynechococcus sp.]